MTATAAAQGRNCFELEGAKGTEYIDPLAAYDVLVEELEGDLSTPLRDAATPLPEQGDGDEAAAAVAEVSRLRAAARRRLTAAARAAFGLPPVDRATGEGVPDREALADLYRFLDWLKKKAPSPDATPT